MLTYPISQGSDASPRYQRLHVLYLKEVTPPGTNAYILYPISQAYK